MNYFLVIYSNGDTEAVHGENIFKASFEIEHPDDVMAIIKVDS
jgi:hypothetical protein